MSACPKVAISNLWTPARVKAQDHHTGVFTEINSAMDDDEKILQAALLAPTRRSWFFDLFHRKDSK